MYNWRKTRGGLGAPIPITLRIDRPVQTVGDRATFAIIGAPPNASIFWSSYKNGVATGELNADYGHRTESNGTAQIQMAQPWSADQAGDWIKEVLMQDGQGTNYTAMIVFRVIPAPAPVAAPAPTGGGGGILGGSFQIAGVSIPTWLPLVAVGAIVLAKR